MANFYVSATRGSDATGTGTAANPWKTIGKAIGPGPAIATSAPAVLYIEPGVYYEAVTMGLSPTASNTLKIVGDCDGAGFAVGGYATPKTGVVDWSAWSSDTTPLNTPCLNAVGKSYTTVERIRFTAGDPNTPTWSGGLNVKGGTNWTIRDCIAVASHQSATSTGLAYEGATGGGAANILIERCDAYAPPRPFGGCGIGIYLYEQAAEYDANVVIRNCRVFMTASQSGAAGISVFRPDGTGGKLGTGVRIEHCTVFGGSYGVQVYRSETTKPLASPVVVRGCAVLSAVNGIIAGSTTHVAEDYNVWNTYVPRTNVSAGANSVANVRPAFALGEGRLVGVPLRPLLEPTPGSPLAGRVPSGFPAVDLMNRARPEGLGSTSAACGALERHDAGEPDATYADAGSPACLKLAGPGSLDRPILVDPVVTTIRVKVRWDGGHGDAAKPRAVLLANPEVGLLADQVVTATSTGGVGSTPNAYETLTFAPFTPTRAGAVMLRLVSRSASGTGAAYFDSITLS